MKRIKIWLLRRSLRRQLQLYHWAWDDVGGGARIAAQVSPRVSRAARALNRIAAELRAVDPEFPADFEELPT